MNPTKIRRTRVKTLPLAPALKWEPGPIKNVSFDLSDLSAITCVAKVAEEYEKEKAARELRLSVHEFKLRHREVCKLCYAHRLVGGQENDSADHRPGASGCVTRNCRTARNVPMNKKCHVENSKSTDETESHLPVCQEEKEDQTETDRIAPGEGRDIEKAATYPLVGQMANCEKMKSEEQGKKYEKVAQQTKSATANDVSKRCSAHRWADKATSITCPGFPPASAQASEESKATTGDKGESPSTATCTTSEHETAEDTTPHPDVSRRPAKTPRLPRPTSRYTQTIGGSGLKDCCSALRRAFKVFFAVEKNRLSSCSKKK